MTDHFLQEGDFLHFFGSVIPDTADFYMYFTQKSEKSLLIVKKCTIIITIAQKRRIKTERFEKEVLL